MSKQRHLRMNEAELAVWVELVAAFYAVKGRDPAQDEAEFLVIWAQSLVLSASGSFRPAVLH